LVDALVWALGEANVRTLRAQTPTEVLFSGSATHKPLGLAEASLWFQQRVALAAAGRRRGANHAPPLPLGRMGMLD
jgi:chromosome segregation ATPase